MDGDLGVGRELEPRPDPEQRHRADDQGAEDHEVAAVHHDPFGSIRNASRSAAMASSRTDRLR